MKVLHCRDVGFECDGVIRAQSEEEVLRQAAEHAQTQHGVQFTPELAAQVRRHISDTVTSGPDQSSAPNTCVKCNAPLMESTSTCPYCGAEQK
jgi:predicted small metal-binding protein